MGFNLEDYEPVAARLARWLTRTEGHGRVICCGMGARDE